MKNLSLIASAMAMLGLTACEKGLVDEAAVSTTGQVMNSVLQVRTRSGGSAGEEATVAYPIAVYVFAGEECKAVQTIGDEGQTLNIPLVEGTYTVYAIGGAAHSQHLTGQAADITTGSTKTNLQLALLIAHGNGGLRFDQLILEHCDRHMFPKWLHVSYNPNRQRMQILYNASAQRSPSMAALTMPPA